MLSTMAFSATGHGCKEGRAPTTLPTDTLHPSNDFSINSGSTWSKEDGAVPQATFWAQPQAPPTALLPDLQPHSITGVEKRQWSVMGWCNERG